MTNDGYGHERGRERELRIVGFAGPKYSGKDTAAKQLLELNRGQVTHSKLSFNSELHYETFPYFRRLMMAEGVKRIVTEVFGIPMETFEDPVHKELPWPHYPGLEPRWLLMDIANWFRDKYGGEVWANRWERIARADTTTGCFLITDMRFPEEVEMLKRNKGLLIWIDRKEAEDAVLAAQREGEAKALNPSESHYEMLKREADVVVDNNGSIPHLRSQVLSVVRTRYDYWQYWPGMESTERLMAKTLLAPEDLRYYNYA